MPAPTPWPFVTAFGLALLLAGLVTSLAVSIVGFVVILFGAVGWFEMCCRCRKRNWLPLVETLRRYLRAQPEELITCNPAQKVIASTFPLKFILTPPDSWVELSAGSEWRSSLAFMD